MKRTLLTAFIALLTIGVFGLARVPVQAQTTETGLPNNTITVNGVGTVSGSPDIAFLSLGVQIADADLNSAFAQVGEIIQKVTKALTDLGVKPEDIQTSGINIYPQDQYDPQTGETKGRVYQVSTTIDVTIRDLTKIENIISAAVNAGANVVNSLTFGMADQSALEAEARTAAVENARDRANQLATAVGVTIGDPVVVVEIDNLGGQPIPYARMGGGGGGMMAESANVPVNQGQLAVTVQVQITYAIAS